MISLLSDIKFWLLNNTLTETLKTMKPVKSDDQYQEKDINQT